MHLLSQRKKEKKTCRNTQYINVDTSSHRETVLDISRNGIVSRNGRSFRGPLHPPPPSPLRPPFPSVRYPRSFLQVEPSFLFPRSIHFSLATCVALATSYVLRPTSFAPLIRPIRGTKYRSVSWGYQEGAQCTPFIRTADFSQPTLQTTSTFFSRLWRVFPFMAVTLWGTNGCTIPRRVSLDGSPWDREGISFSGWIIRADIVSLWGSSSFHEGFRRFDGSDQCWKGCNKMY